MDVVSLLQQKGVAFDCRHLLQHASACANFELVWDLLAAGEDPNDPVDDSDRPWYPLHAVGGTVCIWCVVVYHNYGTARRWRRSHSY